jgi:septum site-determining protein MinD
MTRRLVVVSGKGGVGKTTLVSNLGYALTELGYDVTLMDANLTTPNLGLHLGLHLTSKTLHDVLKGKTKLKNVIYIHPFGFKVIPASMNINALIGVNPSKLKDVTLSLLGQTEFLILDCSAGLGREAVSAIEASDEVLIITNPELPSVVDALKTIKIAEKLKKKVLGVIVNRKKRSKYELSKKEIEEFLGTKVLAEIPEDKMIHHSIAVKKPLLEYDPESPAAYEIRKLAHHITGREFPYKPSIKTRFPFLNKLINWLTR